MNKLRVPISSKFLLLNRNLAKPMRYKFREFNDNLKFAYTEYTKNNKIHYKFSSQKTKEKYIKPSMKELKDKLTTMEFLVTQTGATERPFSGEYDKFWEHGHYNCVVCSNFLFKSNTKYDAGCGWPAFYQGIEENIEEIEDRSHGMLRTEVVCNKCKAHLGHKFDDGPREKTGVRYCINSAALSFQYGEKENKDK